MCKVTASLVESHLHTHPKQIIMQVSYICFVSTNALVNSNNTHDARSSKEGDFKWQCMMFLAKKEKITVHIVNLVLCTQLYIIVHNMVLPTCALWQMLLFFLPWYTCIHPTMHVTTNFVADWLNSVLQTWSLFQLAKHTQLHAERHN